MTAIVGLVHDGDVWIGGDSAGTDTYWSQSIRADSKVFTTGPYAFGFTTSFRMGQLIRYAFTPPEPGADLERFMVTEFVDALRKCLSGGGYLKKENEQEAGGTFLVGVRGRLFVVDSDFQVGESVDGFDAVGSGASIALGALYASSRRVSPERRVRVALRAAERFNAAVRGPFAVVRTEKAGEA